MTDKPVVVPKDITPKPPKPAMKRINDELLTKLKADESLIKQLKNQLKNPKNEAPKTKPKVINKPIIAPKVNTKPVLSRHPKLDRIKELVKEKKKGPKVVANPVPDKNTKVVHHRYAPKENHPLHHHPIPIEAQPMDHVHDHYVRPHEPHIVPVNNHIGQPMDHSVRVVVDPSTAVFFLMLVVIVVTAANLLWFKRRSDQRRSKAVEYKKSVHSDQDREASDDTDDEQ